METVKFAAGVFCLAMAAAPGAVLLLVGLFGPVTDRRAPRHPDY